MDKETEKMFEILHENKEREQTKEIIERQIAEDKIRLDEEIRRDKKRTIIVGIIIFIVGILCIFLMAKLDEKFISDCTKGGLSENVCRRAA